MQRAGRRTLEKLECKLSLPVAPGLGPGNQTWEASTYSSIYYRPVVVYTLGGVPGFKQKPTDQCAADSGPQQVCNGTLHTTSRRHYHNAQSVTGSLMLPRGSSYIVDCQLDINKARPALFSDLKGEKRTVELPFLQNLILDLSLMYALSAEVNSKQVVHPFAIMYSTWFDISVSDSGGRNEKVSNTLQKLSVCPRL
jgi:hypothetical protein